MFGVLLFVGICIGTIIYASFYYYVMPQVVQSVPVHFTVDQNSQSTGHHTSPNGEHTLIYSPSKALVAHIPIDSALTEVKKKL